MPPRTILGVEVVEDRKGVQQCRKTTHEIVDTMLEQGVMLGADGLSPARPRGQKGEK